LLVALLVHVALGFALAAWRLDLPAKIVTGFSVPVSLEEPAVAPGNPALPAAIPVSLPALPETAVSLPVSVPSYHVEAIAITGPTLATWVIEAPSPSPAACLPGGVGEEGAGNGAGGGGEGAGPGAGHGAVQGVPLYVRCPKPRYPVIARQQGWQGTTLLRVEIRPDGRPGKIEVAQSSGHEVLDSAAVEAVRSARFQADANVWVEVPISFRLNRG
jgi:protein TonB